MSSNVHRLTAEETAALVADALRGTVPPMELWDEFKAAGWIEVRAGMGSESVVWLHAAETLLASEKLELWWRCRDVRRRKVER